MPCGDGTPTRARRPCDRTSDGQGRHWIEKRTGRLELVKIDIDAEQALAARFGIQSIPTVAVFRDGEPVTGFVGAYPPATIGKFLDELLAKEAEAAAA